MPASNVIYVVHVDFLTDYFVIFHTFPANCGHSTYIHSCYDELRKLRNAVRGCLTHDSAIRYCTEVGWRVPMSGPIWN